MKNTVRYSAFNDICETTTRALNAICSNSGYWSEIFHHQPFQKCSEIEVTGYNGLYSGYERSIRSGKRLVVIS